MTSEKPPVEQKPHIPSDHNVLYRDQASTADSHCQAVLSALMDIEEIELEQTPLYEIIDPDALDSLFISESQDSFVSFRYQNYNITISADQHLIVSTPSQ